jgi:neutral ceramidase
MTEQAPPDTLQIGIARADITPPVGTRSAGFAGRGPLSRLHDPLYATVLVAAEGGVRAALIGCDLLGLDAATVAEIRRAVASRTAIPADAVTVSCTHTHYGPDPYRDQDDPLVSAYRANLIHVLAGAVEEAESLLAPAVAGMGWGASDIGVNRREKLPDGRVILGQNPGGAIDRAVGVLRIDAPNGAPVACVVNHQTHPVSQTGQVDHISADYPGRARQVVESLTGATFLYLEGACGNINASIMKPTYESARTLGTRLGCEVVRVWETIAPQPFQGLAVGSRPIQLPSMRYGSAEEAAGLVIELENELADLEIQGASEGRIWWAERRLERARHALESWEKGETPPSVESEVQAWRLGVLGLVTAPGEIFTQIGLAVKQASPFADTFFLSCTNDSIGYVPVPEAYPDGGYEVTHASRVDPEAAGILREECLAALQSVR